VAAALKLRSAALTDAMTQRTQTKRQAIESAVMLVQGLSFEEGRELYKQLPLCQASTSEQLRISVQIAMAMNPKLRFLLVVDPGGSVAWFPPSLAPSVPPASRRVFAVIPVLFSRAS
jgi:hypothetical protein